MIDSSENVFKRTTIYDTSQCFHDDYFNQTIPVAEEKNDSSSRNGSIFNEVESTVFRNDNHSNDTNSNSDSHICSDSYNHSSFVHTYAQNKSIESRSLNGVSTVNCTHARYNQKTIKCASLDACGLRRKVQYPEFCSLVDQYDLFCVCETKLDTYDEIKLSGYEFLSQCRKQKCFRKSGGIGFLLKILSLSMSLWLIQSQITFYGLNWTNVLSLHCSWCCAVWRP